MVQVDNYSHDDDCLFWQKIMYLFNTVYCFGESSDQFRYGFDYKD